MNKESGRLKEKIVFGRNTFAPFDDDDLPICVVVGIAIEELLARLFPCLTRTGEVSKDGIAMSPDAVSYGSRWHLLSPDRDVTLVHEIKATWKSSARMLEEHFSYLQQTKSYCHGVGTLYAIIWILHLMGDYRFDGIGPLLVQHHIRFSEWEIKTNWDEVLRAKAAYGL